MNALVVFAICCIYTAQATLDLHGLHGGGGGGGGSYHLAGVPNEGSYGKIQYPSFDIQDLGSEVHGEIPPKTIKIHESITIKEPKPYPVQVPHPVPYPVHVPKPIPVTVTKLVHVPHKVPVEVIKHVHVPVEVPKPYPVPVHESSGGHGGADFGGGHGGLGLGGGLAGLGGLGGHGGGDWAASNGLHTAALHGDLSSYGQGLGAYGHEGQADQSGAYPVVAPVESQNQGIQDLVTDKQ